MSTKTARFVTALGGGILAAACAKASAPAIAPSSGGGTDVQSSDERVDAAGSGKLERYRIEASVRGVDDMLTAGGKFAQAYISQGETFDARAELQALLLQTGFGPGFLDGLDLAGVHTLDMSYPHQEQQAAPGDVDLAASIAVHDGRRVIDHMPASSRPQPLGSGMWEIVLENQRLLIREAGTMLLAGLDNGDLERAAELGKQSTQSRRIRLRASNLPRDDVDPRGMLGLAAGSALGDRFAEVARNLSVLEAELDFGTDRDLTALAAVDAPFHRLGLEPLGAPRSASTRLESMLPGAPVFAAALSWGTPGPLHGILDRELPIAEIPPPFDELARNLVKHAHTILDVIRNDVAIAVYLSDKGQTVMVLAAEVSDEGRAREALRGIDDVIVRALETQAKLAGKNAGGRFQVTWKPDGIALSGTKADQLVITIPKDFLDRTRPVSTFLAGNRLESIALVRDGIAVVAIGAGARKAITDVSKNLRGGRSTLATDGGLDMVRKTYGCQICITADWVDGIRLALLVERDTVDDKGAKARLNKALASIRKLELGGTSGVGLAITPDRAVGAVAIPKATVLAPRDRAQALLEAARALDAVAPPSGP